VETAAKHGNAEVELGKLAAERAQSADVKQFAQMMIRDHSKANDELKQVASRENMSVSTPAMDQKHQQLMTKLRTLRGAEFDREYMRAMVDGHKEAQSLLGDRADRGGNNARNQRGTGATGTSGSAAAGGSTQLDTAVNQWASKTLPTVEQHLQRAEQIHSKLEGGNANQRNTTGGNTRTGGGSTNQPAGRDNTNPSGGTTSPSQGR
jgi:putative membrane protein